MLVSSLKEKILKEYIHPGNIIPGTKLPTVKELAEQFGVSSPTIGKTIAAMADEGWLVKRRGSGIYVGDKKPIVFNSSRDGKSSYRIGTIVPNMSLELAHRVFEGVEFMIRQNNSILEVANSVGLIKEEKRHIEAMRDRGVDGIVLYPTPGRDEEYLGTEFENFPIVVVDFYTPEMNRSHVIFDNQLAGREMTRYLWSRGCRRIAFVKFDDEHVYPSVDARAEGYRQALKDFGCSDSDIRIFRCGLWDMTTWEYFETCVETILAQDTLPDAIIFPSDNFAHHALQLMKSKGGTLAQEIQVAGFDNLQVPHMESNWPTTKPDFVRLGELATEMLFEILRTGNLGSREMLLPCPLLASNTSKLRMLSFGSRYPNACLLTARSGSGSIAESK